MIRTNKRYSQASWATWKKAETSQIAWKKIRITGLLGKDTPQRVELLGGYGYIPDFQVSRFCRLRWSSCLQFVSVPANNPTLTHWFTKWIFVCSLWSFIASLSGVSNICSPLPLRALLDNILKGYVPKLEKLRHVHLTYWDGIGMLSRPSAFDIRTFPSTFSFITCKRYRHLHFQCNVPNLDSKGQWIS